MNTFTKEIKIEKPFLDLSDPSHPKDGGVKDQSTLFRFKEIDRHELDQRGLISSIIQVCSNFKKSEFSDQYNIDPVEAIKVTELAINILMIADSDSDADKIRFEKDKTALLGDALAMKDMSNFLIFEKFFPFFLTYLQRLKK